MNLDTIDIKNIIDKNVPSDSLIEQLIVFPKHDLALSPRPLKYFRSVALLLLKDGTLWLLNMPSAAWTSERLEKASKVLSGLSLKKYDRDYFQKEIRTELALNQISLTLPTLPNINNSEWGIHENSKSIYSSRQRDLIKIKHADENYLAKIKFIEKLISSQIYNQLNIIYSSLTQRAIDIATKNNTLDITVYNYLAHKKYAKYRQQFAISFPSLLSSTIVSEPGTIGYELRGYVDTGVPIIKNLSSKWSIRPSVIKHLVGKNSEYIGDKWNNNVKALALLMNALRPEDLPRNNLAEWEHFNRVVEVGTRIFNKLIWECSSGLLWFRECIHYTTTGSEKAISKWLPNNEIISRISDFREYFEIAIKHDARKLSEENINTIADNIENIIDKFFENMACKGLGKIAIDFDQKFANLYRDLKKTSNTKSRREVLPMVPEDYISTDRTRVVRSLTTYSEILSIGKLLNNCIDRIRTNTYLAQGARAESFLIGIFEYGTDRPCSAADIDVTHYPETKTYSLMIREHHAYSNATPSAECSRAMEEFLIYCKGPAVYKHLKDVWKMVKETNKIERASELQMIGSAIIPAVKYVIGENVYQQLLDGIIEN